MAEKHSGNNRSRKDQEMAARMKREGVERTIQRCPLCYQIVSRESVKSRYTHICRG